MNIVLQYQITTFQTVWFPKCYPVLPSESFLPQILCVKIIDATYLPISARYPTTGCHTLPIQVNVFSLQQFIIILCSISYIYRLHIVPIIIHESLVTHIRKIFNEFVIFLDVFA